MVENLQVTEQCGICVFKLAIYLFSRPVPKDFHEHKEQNNHIIRIHRTVRPETKYK